jgi:hypothetical protein
MFAERQKIVVIDDKFEEIQPLLEAFGKKGISYLWFDGSMKNLPDTPFTGVRLMFLDIALNTKGVSEKNMASALANCVKKILGDKHEPYFIVFWTKHFSQIDQVITYLKSDGIAPIGYIDAEKPTSSDAQDDVSELITRLDTKFKELKAFNYLLDWESTIEKSVSDFSNDFFSDIPSDGDIDAWSNQVASMLGTLALSYADGNNFGNTAEDLRNAFLMLSNSFQDNVQKTIKSKQFTCDTALSDKQLNLELLSKLNSSLFVDFQSDKTPALGNVFIDKNPDVHLQEALEKNVFPNKIKPEGMQIVGMVITPACDLAHKKYLHNTKKCFRVLYGLLVPVCDPDGFEKYFKPDWIGKKENELIQELRSKKVEEKHIKIVIKKFQQSAKSDALFITEPFWYSDKSHALIFHFGSLTSLWWNEEETPHFEFAIKEHLAFDIQSKMANHANRLGNAMLSLR